MRSRLAKSRGFSIGLKGGDESGIPQSPSPVEAAAQGFTPPAPAPAPAPAVKQSITQQMRSRLGKMLGFSQTQQQTQQGGRRRRKCKKRTRSKRMK